MTDELEDQSDVGRGIADVASVEGAAVGAGTDDVQAPKPIDETNPKKMLSAGRTPRP